MLNSPVEILFFTGTILGAAYVRGYGGFGFSMITVAGLSLMFPPVAVVPAVLMLEVVASACLLPGVWKDIDWKTLAWLSGGVAAGIPVGVRLLAGLPEPALRIGIALVVAVLAGLLRTGYVYNRPMGRAAILGIGTVSGLFNGSAAVGGPPVILFFFSSPTHAHVSRASLIAFFFGSDLIASGVCAGSGMISPDTLKLFLAALLPLVIGVFAGNREFVRTEPEVFRHRVLLFLILVSGLLLIKGIWETGI